MRFPYILPIHRKSLICLLFLFFTVPVICHAAPAAEISPSPSWLLPRNPDFTKPPKDRDVSYGYYLTLYDQQVNVGLQTTYFHTIKKITNENGVQSNSEIAISFSGDFQHLYFHTISISRDGKTINKLDRSKIRIEHEETDVYDHMYNGLYQAYIILDDIRKGDQIEVAYSLKGENPIFKNKYCNSFSFVAHTNITNHYTSIIMPPGRKLLYKCFNNAAKPVVTDKGSSVVYDFPVLNLEPYNYISSVPSWYYDYPYVEMSELGTWKEVIDWASDIMNYTSFTLPDGLKKRIGLWSSSSNGDAALFTEKATRFVQDEIRYQGIEVGEYTHRPHLPAETFNNRYGDCKDKSILLATILRSHSIPAFVVLVSTDWKGHLTEHLPGTDKFDHVIVKTIVNGKTLWIDPTFSMQKGSILSNYIPAYGKGLVVDKTADAPEDIVQGSPPATEITETYTVPETNKDAADLDVSTILTSGNADDMRSSLSDGLKSLEKSYEKYYTDQLGKTKMKGGLEIEDDTVANKILIKEAYSIDQIWEDKETGQTLDIFAKNIYDKLPKPDKNVRVAPVALSFPVDLKYTAVLDMPIPFTVAGNGLVVKSSSYYYSFKSETIGNKLSMTYVLKTYKDHIPAEEVAQYKKDYDKIFETLDYTFTYKPAKSGAGSGPLNWIAVLTGLMLALILLLVFPLLNRRDSAYTSYTRQPQRISGWPVLLGFIICISILINITSLLKSDYFKTGSWIILSASGNTGMQLLFMVDMIYKLTTIIFACWVLYWYFKKRDIFPQMFIAFGVMVLVMNITIVIIGSVFGSEIEPYFPGYSQGSTSNVLSSIVFLGIWGTALSRSAQTGLIFTRPHRYKTIPDTFETVELQQEAYKEINDQI